MATFTQDYDKAITLSLPYDVLKTEFENQTQQVRLKNTSVKRMWTLFFENRTQSEYDTFKTFWDARYGTFEAFDWTYKSVSYSVRFASDPLFTESRYQRYNWQVNIEEAL